MSSQRITHSICVILVLLTALARGASSGPSEIIINEILYNASSDNTGGEFIEFFNPGSGTVNLSGWVITEAVDFTFPSGSLLQSGDFLVIARDADEAAIFYGVPIFGQYDGKLDNAGETIVLKDETGSLIDSVAYGDIPPWPTEADGGGPSLELFDPSSDNNLPGNWGIGQDYTPGAPNNPAFPGAGDIVISEIMYKPQRHEPRLRYDAINNQPYTEVGDDEWGEYVELYNRSDSTIDLSGWSFTEGIRYTFPEGTLLLPSKFLVVSASPEVIAERYAPLNPAGPWEGNLDNGGERITLRTAAPKSSIVDTVRYDDEYPWPIGPDEYGHALECIDLDQDNGTCANWRSSHTPLSDFSPLPVWQFVTITGSATSNSLYIFLDGAGEWLLDDVRLTASGDTSNLIPNGSFETDETGWNKTGNHSGTYHSVQFAHDGNACEHIVATAAGESSINSLNITSIPGVSVGVTYTLSMWVKYVSGMNSLTFRLSGGGLKTTVTASALQDKGPTGNGTPGTTNSVIANGIPPLVDHIAFTPQKPKSIEPVTVTAQVTDASPIAHVKLETFLGVSSSSTTYVMYDDGYHGDDSAGDGVYGVQVPPQPSQTLVHFRIIAEDTEGCVTTFPYEDDPSPTFAYYHFDDEITTGLTQYHLWMPQASIDALEADIWTEDYQDCSLVIDHTAYPHIGVHYRGRGSRSNPKRQYQFRFNRNQLYDGNRTLDTMLARPDVQQIAFDIINLVGLPNLQSDLIRMHINGSFHGVYSAFESPNSAWLEKHDQDSDGEIFKARVCETAGQHYNSDLFTNLYTTDQEYWGVWGKSTHPLESPLLIRELIDKLNNLPDSELLPWLDSHVDLDQWFTFWGLRIAMNIDDFLCHNYYLYLPGGEGGKWRQFMYDFDSFGRMAYLRPHYGDGLGGESPDWQRNMFYRRVTNNPTLSRLYHLSLRQLLNDSFREDLIFPVIDSWFEQSSQDRIDENAMWGTMLTETSSLKSLITTQRNNLLAYLNGLNLPGVGDVPSISPVGGTYDDTVLVTISTPCVAYYTLDGSDPRLSSTGRIYENPIPVTHTSTLTVAGLCDVGVLPTPTPVPVQNGPWDASTQWSLTDNPNGVWRYEDGNGNLLTTTSPQWNLPDFPLGNPGWLGPAGSLHAGWALSNGHHGGEVATSSSPPKDWPEGSVGTHSPTFLTWTSSINGTISILGSFWKMRDWITARGAYPGNGTARPCPVSIFKNTTIIAGPYTLNEQSSNPGKSSSNPALLQAQTAVSVGDTIRVKVDGIDFVAFHFSITQITKRRSYHVRATILPSSGAWTDLTTTQYIITGTNPTSNVHNWGIYSY